MFLRFPDNFSFLLRQLDVIRTAALEKELEVVSCQQE